MTLNTDLCDPSRNACNDNGKCIRDPMHEKFYECRCKDAWFGETCTDVTRKIIIVFQQANIYKK